MYICSASTDLFRCFLEKFAITTYPRKGTETRIHRSFFNVFQCLILQLIPVRGRKKPLELIHGHLNYNLSPRGDGNPIFLSAIVIYIPITTYPRKGTKTFLFFLCKVDIRTNYNLSPQGDGKNLGTDPLDKNYNLPSQGDNKAPPLLAFYQQRRCFVLSLFYLRVTGQVSCLRKWSL